MSDPFVLPLSACRDRRLVGGKAAGLASLINQGFRVPQGICLTTAAYAAALRAIGIDAARLWSSAKISTAEERRRLLREAMTRMTDSPLPPAVEAALWAAVDRLHLSPEPLWAVRSSATVEDGARWSLAGQYETTLGVLRAALPRAVAACWASLWAESAVVGLLRVAQDIQSPQMAVVVQPVIHARSAGVVFSVHPFGERDGSVVINAVLGLGAPLVHGEATPDEFVVRPRGSGEDWTIVGRRIVPKRAVHGVTPDGVRPWPVADSLATAPALSDGEVVALTRIAKQVERAVGYPVDMEWAMDDTGFWVLQARPITTSDTTMTNEGAAWSRANFKETLPECPSPTGLSFLEEYMEHNMLRHYRELGCRIPPGLSPVRVVQGRPFINLTLFQGLVAQLGGDPALVTEQMGGVGTVPPGLPPRLPFPRYIRAGLLVWREMRRALRDGPGWCQDMKQMSRAPTGASSSGDRIQVLLKENEVLGQRLHDRDPTFGIAMGVGQGLDVLGRLLAGWFPSDWRAVLNGVLQGQGTVISAQQIAWLADLAERASTEDAVRDFFLAEPWEPSRYRTDLTGTAFLPEWDRFLAAYGHRALGESDIMVPRHADRPDFLLGVVRGHLRSGSMSSSRAVLARQESVRSAALSRIRRRVRRLPGAWLVFHWWYRRLCRFLALREANRHYLMYFLVAVRRRLLEVGALLVHAGRLEQPDDIFFLTVPEIRSLGEKPDRTWQAIVAARRRERGENEAVTVPDFLSPTPVGLASELELPDDAEGIRGIPISPGLVTGPVCIVRTVEDLGKVRQGAILVLPVVDPGLAPYFGLAAGVVAEMGGTLSHGAIIAREYGIPAIANAAQATQVFNDGETIEMDAYRGVIRRLRQSHAE